MTYETLRRALHSFTHTLQESVLMKRMLNLNHVGRTKITKNYRDQGLGIYVYIMYICYNM